MFVYVLLRAHSLSFTHDESITYTIVAGDPSWERTANHHILNTLLMKVCYRLWGGDELPLRLPNVLSFLLYAAGCYSILKQEKRFYLFLLGMILLFTNPFVTDFFSLARGYGLSLGFMMLSLHFLLKQSDHGQNTETGIYDLILSLTFGSLALCASLAMINYYIACIAINCFMSLFPARNIRKKSLIRIPVFFLSGLPLFLATKRLFFLMESGELYFGEDRFMAVVSNLVSNSLYFTIYPAWVPVALKVIALLSLPVAIISIVIKGDYPGQFSMITSLIVILITGIWIEHSVFSARYPIERTALYFIPIFGLFFFWFASHLLEFYTVPKTLYTTLIISICIFLGYNDLKSLNLSYTKTWRYDSHTKDAMKIIEERTREFTSCASISNSWIFEPAMNYYIATRKIKVNATNRDGVNYDSDFIYRHEDNLTHEQYEVLCEFDDIKTNLLVRRSISENP